MDALKSEMINWILSLKDESQTLKVFQWMKKHVSTQNTMPTNTPNSIRQPGFGKHIFLTISDDFNEPVETINPSNKDIISELYGSWESDLSSDELAASIRSARI